MIDAIRPSVTVVVQDIRSPPLLSHASPTFYSVLSADSTSS